MSEAHPARERLAIALDVDEWQLAEALVRRVDRWFGIAKVGLELYAAAGPDCVARLHDLGMRVFADLKLYDIPTTVERAARVLGRRGVDFLNVPAALGGPALEAGVRGVARGAHEAGLPPPVALGVTVLTSEPDADAFDERLEVVVSAGCHGVVCSAFEVGAAHARGLRAMVPGVRFAGQDAHDQARVTTPADAAARGADWLVIGRAVTRATDPESAARAVADAVRDHTQPPT